MNDVPDDPYGRGPPAPVDVAIFSLADESVRKIGAGRSGIRICEGMAPATMAVVWSNGEAARCVSRATLVDVKDERLDEWVTP